MSTRTSIEVRMSRKASLAVASAIIALVAARSLRAQTNGTTIGTLTAVNASCNSVTATAAFTGDANNNGTTTFEYNTSNTWPGTASCTVSGPSPRVCAITGLASPNTYWVRATFADADGVVGTNPTAGVSTGTPLPACGADAIPPTVTILSPARNAAIGGTETVKVQAFDAVAMAATPVLFSVDGAALSATGVTVSPNYNCDDASAPGKCKVYLFDINTTLLANGPHYFTIQAVDASGNRSTLSWAFRVNNTGTTAAGSGQILRRTKGSQLCQDCHALETHSSQYNTTNYGNWSVECLGCHTSHGTTNIYLVRPSIDTPNSGQKGVDFRNTTGVATNSYGTPAASGNGVNVCEVCHTRTKNPDTTARARNNAPTDWTKHYTSRCTGCHAHKDGFAAGESGGGVVCSGCHSAIWNRMQASGGSTYKHTLGIGTAADDAVAWGSPLNANAPNVRSCVNMCHDDHPHTATDDPSPTLHYNLAYKDATSNASRAAATRTVATKAKTDFDNSLPNGGLCVSCHRNPVESGATPAHPAVAQAAYASSAHNTTSTTPGGAWQFTLHDGSNFARNCTKCHWDSADGTTPTVSGATALGGVHGSSSPSLLMGTTNPAGAPAGFVCYRCHGGGVTGADYSGKNLATVMARARAHPANSDAVHDSATERNTAAFGNMLGLAGPTARHSNCLDCHDPHESKPSVPRTAYTTGTATATSGGTTVTGSGTTWTSGYVGGRIRNNALGVWHWVTAVGSATSITITPAATAAWTGAYTLESALHRYFTGTATLTAASTTVAGTGTGWTSALVGWYIKNNTQNTWYRITAVASATSLTIASAATAGATGAYTIMPGNAASPSLEGAWGAQLSTNPAFWTNTTSTSFTKQTLASATGLEATLCFKCHTAYYWGAGADPGRGVPPPAPSGGTYTTGTAAFTNGSTTVTGTGTTWAAASHVGWVIKNNANGTWYLVTAVASSTSLTISPAANFTAAASAYTLQMAETDVAKEFNPNNVGNFAGTWASGETAGSFHPVLATAGSNLGAVNLANLVTTSFPWSTTSRNLMSCSDCHASDQATDPNGPHGSTASFILRGPNTTWNSSVTLGSTIPAGTFCLNCHANSFTNSRFPNHSRSDHFVSCWNCHAAIPHGGPRPGMLVAGAGANANVGGVIAGWDQTPPYWQGGTTNRLYLVSYPANNTTAWAQGNCGCNGTGH